MDLNEYRERLDILRMRIAKKSEERDNAERARDLSNNARLQNEIRELMAAIEELRKEARQARLSV
jgi:hypothetical protein